MKKFKIHPAKRDERNSQPKAGPLLAEKFKIKLRVGDEILVTAGKDKRRKGKIEAIYPKTGRVLVPDLNVYKKHVKGGGSRKGGIVEISRPLPVSNVQIICPNCKKATRVGFKLKSDGEKVRICRKCKREIDRSSASRSS